MMGKLEKLAMVRSQAPQLKTVIRLNKIAGGDSNAPARHFKAKEYEDVPCLRVEESIRTEGFIL
jgi:hypothetical protein